MSYVDYIKQAMNKNNWSIWEISSLYMNASANDLLLELTDGINKDYSLNASPELVLQWTPVFLQMVLNNQDNLQQALEQYEYPDEYPNLTIDRTEDFTIDRDNRCICSNHYLDDDGNPELVETPWLIHDSKNDHNFMFGNRFVVLPDDRVLMFD